jgi:hypothetical protein
LKRTSIDEAFEPLGPLAAACEVTPVGVGEGVTAVPTLNMAKDNGQAQELQEVRDWRPLHPCVLAASFRAHAFRQLLRIYTVQIDKVY